MMRTMTYTDAMTRVKCTVTLVLVLVVLLTPDTHAADPVYTPTNINDTAGNSADSTGAITWADLPTGLPYNAASPERISGGLEGYYGMVHGFISAVFIQGFPQEIIEKLIESDTNYIINNYSNYINHFLGYGICIVVGLLFFLIFPIVACCFCCCRCCGNCGGKMHQAQPDADNTCKKMAFTIILIVSTAFLATSTALIFVNNDNMSTAITGAPAVVKDNLDDIKIFTNNTVTEATHIISTNFLFVKQALFRDLDNIDYLVGLPIREGIKNATNISTTLSAAYALVDGMDNADSNLTAVESALSNLNTAVTTLSSSITTVKTDMSNILTTCGTNCPDPKPDVSGAGTDIDTNSFPDLSDARTNMDNAKNTNLSAQIQDAEAELDNIPETVKNDSNSTVADMKQTITDLSDQLDEIMDQITDINGQVEGENATIDLDQLSADIEDYSDTLETYDKYRWYGGLGLACIVLLVVIFGALGIVMGFLGSNIKTPPTERGCVGNCGGCLLIVGTAFILIFSAFLMLLTFPTFMIGSPMHQLICRPITDLDELEKMVQIYNDHEVGEGKYFLGDMVLQNDTIDLTLTGALKACRDGSSIYSAFKLDSMFDIDDKLNYSKDLNITGELDKVTVDFSSVNIYSADMKTQLADLKSAVNISFDDFYTELNRSTSSTNLTALAEEIDQYVVGNPGIPALAQAQLTDQATEIRRIRDEDLAYVNSNVTALNDTVAAMEASVADMPGQIDALDTGLQYADDYLQNNGSALVKTELEKFADRMLSIIDSYVDFTKSAIQTQFGKCAPVWNIYNSLLVHTLCYNLMDSFNGFWFSLGWSVFFFMFSLIFSVKLAKYYRRMSPDVDDGYTLPRPHSGKVAPAEVVESGVLPTGGKFSYDKVSNEHFRQTPAKLWAKNNKIAHYDTDCLIPAPPTDTSHPSANALYGRPMLASEMTTCSADIQNTTSDHPANAWATAVLTEESEDEVNEPQANSSMTQQQDLTINLESAPIGESETDPTIDTNNKDQDGVIAISTDDDNTGPPDLDKLNTASDYNQDMNLETSDSINIGETMQSDVQTDGQTKDDVDQPGTGNDAEPPKTNENIENQEIELDVPDETTKMHQIDENQNADEPVPEDSLTAETSDTNATAKGLEHGDVSDNKVEEDHEDGETSDEHPVEEDTDSLVTDQVKSEDDASQGVIVIGGAAKTEMAEQSVIGVADNTEMAEQSTLTAVSE